MLNTVGQSPLGAFIESALGARTVEDGVPQDLIYTINSSIGVHCFDALNLSTLFGPLDLDTSLTNPVGLDVDRQGLRIFVNFDGGDVAAFDAAGGEVWSAAAGAGESFGHGLGFDGTRVFTAFVHETDSAGDTLTLQARDPVDGDVLDSTVVYQDTVAPKVVNGVGLVVLGGFVYTLVSENEPTSGHRTITVYCHRSSDLAEIASRELDSNVDSGFDDLHVFLGRGPVYPFVGLADGGTTNVPEYEALDPADLTSVSAQDYTAANSGNSLPTTAVSLDETADEADGPFFFESSVGPGLSKYELDGTLVRTGAEAVSPVFYQAVSVTRGSLRITDVDDQAVTTSAYSKQLVATGGTPTAWILQIAPAGATISGSGLVEWASPVKAGSPHSFRAYVANASGWDAEDWEVTVQDTAPVITAVADDGALAGNPYLKPMSLSSGDTPVTWSLDAAPAGATINSSGVVSWPVPVAGAANWTVRATNAVGFDTESWTTTVF